MLSGFELVEIRTMQYNTDLFLNYIFSFSHVKSKTNIASLGVRQIQRRITCSGFTRTVDVQVNFISCLSLCTSTTYYCNPLRGKEAL